MAQELEDLSLEQLEDLEELGEECLEDLKTRKERIMGTLQNLIETKGSLVGKIG